MTANGVLLRFSCQNGEQYDNIGAFWDYMAGFYPIETLSGIGFGWKDDSLSYLIGWVDQEPLSLPETLQADYPQAQAARIDLPDSGWLTYDCRTDGLDEAYDQIYRDGPLDYEIERFDGSGNCRLLVFRAPKK
ncbi:MAG: hypothetical protein PHE47_02085 [Oscillospiraceae bacterium]|nr:hypothetical protein [Oscillospiraceae bacterium]